jgi:hypothetical protein
MIICTKTEAQSAYITEILSLEVFLFEQFCVMLSVIFMRCF